MCTRPLGALQIRGEEIMREHLRHTWPLYAGLTPAVILGLLSLALLLAVKA